MDKERLREKILLKLSADHLLLIQAAKSSHAAATHEDNVPDSKYETLALEASYIAQGQANRAMEIKRAIEAYRQLVLQSFTEKSSIRMSALVQLEDEKGHQRLVFLGPAAGGLKIADAGKEITLITPESPLGQELIGRHVDDSFQIEAAAASEYEITAIE